MLARRLLREHFQILGSYFLPPVDSRTMPREHFLNLWIRDLPFKLDHFPDLPCYVLPWHFQTTFDDKSGYEHLKIHPDSQEYFSSFWRCYQFSFCTLPFGWKASVYLYHNVGTVVTSTARSLGLPVLHYIDDRHVVQLFLSGLAICQPSHQLAQTAVFILLFLLISARYMTLLTLQRVLQSHPLLLNSWVSSPILYCKLF